MFCEKCGAKIHKDAEFCRHCGAKVTSIDENEIERELTIISKEKVSRKSFIIFILCLVVICFAVFVTMDYFGIINTGLTDFLKKDTSGDVVTQENIVSDFFKTVEEQKEENTQKTAATSPPANDDDEPNEPQYADVVYTIKNNFYGEWQLIGYKDYLEDETTAVENVFYYIIIKDGTATTGSYGPYYTDDIVHNGPYGAYFTYMDSGGINNYNYLDSPSGINDYMIDSDGNLLALEYNGSGQYEKGIYVYEKKSTGFVESYLNSQGKSLYDQFIDKDDYVFSPINTGGAETHYFFGDIFHWSFVGFAQNPYYDGEYDPWAMLDFASYDAYSWKSYFKLDWDYGEYYSSSAGSVELYVPHEYSDEYSTTYYKVSNTGGANVKSLNIFFGIDGRTYVCMATDDDAHECTSHFYVYEVTAPDLFSKTRNINVSVEDFIGIWKSMGKIYYKTGESASYKDDDFDIYVIDDGGQMEVVQHIYEYGEDSLYTYYHEYIDMDGYLQVYEYFEDPEIVTLFFINNDGQLVCLDYKINSTGLVYVAYSLYEPYYGSLDDCVEESFN